MLVAVQDNRHDFSQTGSFLCTLFMRILLF